VRSILAVLLVSLGLVAAPSAAVADEGVVPECVALVLSTTVLHGQQTVTVCRP
jgi:hypothetical protein